jgi:hypothetical protein
MQYGRYKTSVYKVLGNCVCKMIYFSGTEIYCFIYFESKYLPGYESSKVTPWNFRISCRKWNFKTFLTLPMFVHKIMYKFYLEWVINFFIVGTHTYLRIEQFLNIKR